MASILEHGFTPDSLELLPFLMGIKSDDTM